MSYLQKMKDICHRNEIITIYLKFQLDRSHNDIKGMKNTIHKSHYFFV